MKDAKVTAGETAVKTSSVKDVIIETIVALLMSVGASFKKVGGSFVTERELVKFISTLMMLSDVGPYATTVTVGGGVYPLESYQIDTRVASAFVQPRAVLASGNSPLRKDVSAHPTYKEVMTPAECIEFQYKFFALFKTLPNLANVNSAIGAVNLGEVVDCANDTAFHVEDLASVKSIPPILTIASDLYEDGYFSTPASEVVRMVCVNFYSEVVK
jgi:hypothetical protein